MLEWDPGPAPNIRAIFDQAPLDQYMQRPDLFRLEWGPIYYRGRTDGSAKVLVIGQDPAANENLARRVLVGTAGRRVQGFLSKIGVTRSYIMVNSVLYSIYGQFDKKLRDFTDIPAVANWRNSLLDSLATPNLQAVLAFGLAARHVVETWPGSTHLQSQGKVFYLTHPTATEKSVRLNWTSNMSAIAQKVSPDADGKVDLTPYAGSKFKKSDLARIPLADFGFGSPRWMGTGNMAVGLNDSSKPIPKLARKNKPAIIWIALSGKG